MPTLQSCFKEPLWDQFQALLPIRQETHPWGDGHRQRIPDRIVFNKLLDILVLGGSYRHMADQSCSATTIGRRRDEWIASGAMQKL